jgi:hypothetical protein
MQNFMLLLEEIAVDLTIYDGKGGWDYSKPDDGKAGWDRYDGKAGW